MSVFIGGKKIDGWADRDSPRPFTILIGHASNTDRLLVNGDEGGCGVEWIEGVPESDGFHAVLLADVGQDYWGGFVGHSEVYHGYYVCE